MGRPFTFANLAMTLDGKIAAYDRADLSLGSRADRLEMDRLRARADIVIWGGETLRTARHPARVHADALVKARLERGAPAQPANGLVTRRGVFPPDLPWFASGETERFIFTGAAGAQRFGEAQGGGANIVLLDGTAAIAPQVLDYLGACGMENVLFEGGGVLIWEFVRHIDAFYVTLTPWLAGGAEAPTLMDGPGFASGEFLGLVLRDVRQVGDELFLHYARKTE